MFFPWGCSPSLFFLFPLLYIRFTFSSAQSSERHSLSHLPTSMPVTPSPWMVESTYGVTLPLLVLSRNTLTDKPRGVPRHPLGDSQSIQVGGKGSPSPWGALWHSHTYTQPAVAKSSLFFPISRNTSFQASNDRYSISMFYEYRILCGNPIFMHLR